MFVSVTDSSAGLLVEFHEHVTGLHVPDHGTRRPNTQGRSVDATCTASSEPPTTFVVAGAAFATTGVVVAVRSTEHHALRVMVWCRRHRITGVSAVPGHRQLVLTNLITDGERRVFSRVPQTRSTLDL